MSTPTRWLGGRRTASSPPSGRREGIAVTSRPRSRDSSGGTAGLARRGATEGVVVAPEQGQGQCGHRAGPAGGERRLPGQVGPQTDLTVVEPHRVAVDEVVLAEPRHSGREEVEVRFGETAEV